MRKRDDQVVKLRTSRHRSVARPGSARPTRRRDRRGLALAAGVATICALAGLATVPAGVAGYGSGRGGVKKKVVGRFDAPVDVAAAPGVRAAYVVEQPGRVRVIRHRKRKRPFLDIRGKVLYGGEQGLLSIAFDPGFGSNRLAYLYYTNNAGNNVVAEVRARAHDPLLAKPKTLRTVLVIEHPGESNHNGGQLAFGPDGLLYIGTGDGGGERDPGDNAQDRSSLLGKILRIDPHRSGSGPYTVAPSNPFVGGAGRDEIFAFGFRNPYRFSIDRARGKARIAIGDVGQDRFEEVDYENLGTAKGRNFGWNDWEGFVRTPFGHPPLATKVVKPVFVYGTHTRGRCAIVGGLVTRHRRPRTLRGRYLYGDFCSGELRSFVPSTRRARGDRSLGIRVPELSSLAAGGGGKTYATSLEGPVYRLKEERRRVARSGAHPSPAAR
jgi:glucose/arabinose dehydrogenase